MSTDAPECSDPTEHHFCSVEGRERRVAEAVGTRMARDEADVRVARELVSSLIPLIRSTATPEVPVPIKMEADPTDSLKKVTEVSAVYDKLTIWRRGWDIDIGGRIFLVTEIVRDSRDRASDRGEESRREESG